MTDKKIVEEKTTTTTPADGSKSPEEFRHDLHELTKPAPEKAPATETTEKTTTTKTDK